MRFLETDSCVREAVRIHLGELHMKEELLRAVEDRFGKEERADCVDCPGIRLDTNYLRREHILEDHPWLQLSLVEDQVCGTVECPNISMAEEDIGILSKLQGITVERTFSTLKRETKLGSP